MEETGRRCERAKTGDLRATDYGILSVDWLPPSWWGACLDSTLVIVLVLADWRRLSLSRRQKNSGSRCGPIQYCFLSLSSFCGRREPKFSTRSVNGHVNARECIRDIALLRRSIERPLDVCSRSFFLRLRGQASFRVCDPGRIHGDRHLPARHSARHHESNFARVYNNNPSPDHYDLYLQCRNGSFFSSRSLEDTTSSTLGVVFLLAQLGQ